MLNVNEIRLLKRILFQSQKPYELLYFRVRPRMKVSPSLCSWATSEEYLTKHQHLFNINNCTNINKVTTLLMNSYRNIIDTLIHPHEVVFIDSILIDYEKYTFILFWLSLLLFWFKYVLFYFILSRYIQWCLEFLFYS